MASEQPDPAMPRAPRLLLLALLLAIPGSALALPTDLVDKVEAGVLCRAD